MDAYNLIYETKTMLLRSISESLKANKTDKETSKTVLLWVDEAFNLGVKVAINPAQLFTTEETERRRKGIRIALEELGIEYEKENLEK